MASRRLGLKILDLPRGARVRFPPSALTKSTSAKGLRAARHSEQHNSGFSKENGSNWARLLRKIVEVDPLVCTCGARMQIVSFITDPWIADRILRHRESEHCKAKDPSAPRAPPGAHTRSRP
ncbi:MAG: hypothetical protein ABSH28_02495 [Acidobacteriota bacterium]